MSQELTDEEIYLARQKAQDLGDPWLAMVIRRMTNELRELKDQHAAAQFIQGLGV